MAPFLSAGHSVTNSSHTFGTSSAGTHVHRFRTSFGSFSACTKSKTMSGTCGI